MSYMISHISIADQRRLARIAKAPPPPLPQLFGKLSIGKPKPSLLAKHRRKTKRTAYRVLHQYAIKDIVMLSGIGTATVNRFEEHRDVAMRTYKTLAPYYGIKFIERSGRKEYREAKGMSKTRLAKESGFCVDVLRRFENCDTDKMWLRTYKKVRKWYGE